MKSPSFTVNRRKTTPIQTPKSRRFHRVNTLTSMPAGKAVPISAIPLLREDAASRSRVRLSFEMHETAEMLMNSVHVRAMAYVVPMLAMERFDGMDQLNRSYEGKPAYDGGPVIPFVDLSVFGTAGANEVYKYLGLHARPTAAVNTAYLESYNAIFNHRAAQRSPDIQKRTRLQSDLAPAFWDHAAFNSIVPDFDQAVIEGEVALNVSGSKLPVKGIAKLQNTTWLDGANHTASTQYETGGTGPRSFYDGFQVINGASGSQVFYVSEDPDNPGFPGIFAELEDNGISVSLANIELATKTAAFARLRTQYNGLSDDYLIDLLMDGIRIPEQELRQPILVGEGHTVFGMQKRYASDSGALTESVVNGATYIDLNINVPSLNTGGVIMIVAEIVPEQLFERQRDPFLHAQNVNDFPQYLRDELDPEKVQIVKNEFVDIDHDQPHDTFGYAPLNFDWNFQTPRVGGRYYRPTVDAPFDEDRQRIWAAEVQNPTLSQNFYLAQGIHTKPFVDSNVDSFEVTTQGIVTIVGNTVFGPALLESTSDYDEILAEAPIETIEK